MNSQPDLENLYPIENAKMQCKQNDSKINIDETLFKNYIQKTDENSSLNNSKLLDLINLMKIQQATQQTQFQQPDQFQNINYNKNNIFLNYGIRYA